MRESIIPFGGVPQPPEQKARAALVPVPLEATVSYAGGTALGPAALILASGSMELFDERLGYEPIAHGILTRPRVDVSGPVERVLERVQEQVGLELAGHRLPAVVGGEHTVTLGSLRALVEHRGADFTVLSLDAHLDLREQYEGRRLSHACVMRRALEMGLAVRHIGTRSLSAEEAGFMAREGIEPIWARQVYQDPDWLDAALRDLNGPVYLSLDVDGLDAGIMPATGTPEPGGLGWHQVSDWLEAVCARCPVVGLDLVELAPIGGQPAWDFTAARLLYRAMGLALRGPLE